MPPDQGTAQRRVMRTHRVRHQKRHAEMQIKSGCGTRQVVSPAAQRRLASAGGQVALERGVALWRRLAVYCPFLLLLVPGLIGQEATRELQSALGPAGTALALLGDALGSPLVESKEVRDASGVAYATTWVGTPGLALLGGLLLLQMVGNVGERLLTFGVRAPADEDDGNG